MVGGLAKTRGGREEEKRTSVPAGEVLAFTVDVEEYFHVTAFDRALPRDCWQELEPRAERSIDRLLEILDDHGVRATFFVLGWLAERNPALVRRIRAAGHEVASHGYGHDLVYNQAPEQFRADVRRSKAILEDLIGEAVLGYRAPTFSITSKTSWAHPVLAEEGYRYSSSVFPIHHDRYGWPEFGGHPREVVANGSGSLWEFPLSALRLGAIKVPYGGGGYLRLFPFPLTRLLFRAGKRAGSIRILYLHPWEIDPGQPRVALSGLAGLRHYHGLSRMESRIRRLLPLYRWDCMKRFLPGQA